MIRQGPLWVGVGVRGTGVGGIGVGDGGIGVGVGIRIGAGGFTVGRFKHSQLAVTAESAIQPTMLLYRTLKNEPSGEIPSTSAIPPPDSAPTMIELTLADWRMF